MIKHPAEGEIVLNDSYRHLAAHYAAAVLPGRVRAPKDKAIGENTVSHVATWVIRLDRRCSAHSIRRRTGPWLSSRVHADAIRDRNIHNTIWIETGSYNM